MKMAWRRRTVMAGLAIILLSNAVVLGGVAWNRSGEPEAVLRLSERELDLPYRGYGESEKSGLSLILSWRTPVSGDAKNERDEMFEYSHMDTTAHWLNAEKLAELGFDMRSDARMLSGEERDRRALEKVVYLVLELNGPAYQFALKAAQERLERIRKQRQPSAELSADKRIEMAEKALERERERNSRLFVVDGGLDADALRAKYPDRKTHAVVSGRVRPTYQYQRSSRKSQAGYVSAVNVNEINVPLGLRAVFDGMKPVNRYALNEIPSPFEATIVYGRRLEPWIVDASAKK